MSSLVKVQHKGQVTIPTRLRIQAGISAGDLFEASFLHGKIVLTPLLVDRSKLATADDEYTPEQRRFIDARLAQSDEDVKKGRIHGPFPSEEAVRFIKAELRARAKKHKKPNERRSDRARDCRARQRPARSAKGFHQATHLLGPQPASPLTTCEEIRRKQGPLAGPGQ